MSLNTIVRPIAAVAVAMVIARSAFLACNLSRAKGLARSLMLAIALAMPWLPAFAQTIAPAFAETYTLRDLGSAPGVPTNFGGLFILSDQPNTLYLGGTANLAAGALYAVPLTRDGSGLITGFGGPGVRVADLPYNDGGIVRDPGGLVSYVEWPTNAYAQVDLRSGKVVNRIPLDTFGVASASAGVGFIPGGYPGAGGMRIVSWSGGELYDVAYTMSNRGVVSITGVTAVPGSQLPGGPEGWAYVPLGSPQFPSPSMIVSEYSANNVAVYDMDGSGNPVIASRRLFISELTGAEGAAIDPVSGSFLFSTFGGSNRVVVVQGFAPPPAVGLSVSSLSFPTQPVGSTSAPQSVTLTNTGRSTLSIATISVSTEFGKSTTCGATLAANASCNIDVTFMPSAAGNRTGALTISSDAPGSPHSVALSGTGAVPVLALSFSSVDFGSQTVGTASLPQPVTLTNTGGAPLNLSAIAASGDFNFTGCPTPLSLAPGASCTLSIKFVPTAVGARSGGISIGSNASGTPHAIALTGNGTPMPVPGIALAPGSASFGAIVTGTNSTLVLVLSNPGAAPLAISSIGTTGAGFSQTNTCPASLAPSAACNISVKFAPTVVGAASGQLQIVSNAAPSPLNAALSGSGLPATTAALTLSASNVAFPPQFVGTTSAPRTVTLTSSGTAPLVISQVTGSGDFAFSGCGPSTMAPAATCAFSITFRPQAVGALTGSIVVTSNASGSPHTLSLSGNGASLTAPEIVIAPSAYVFGTLRTALTATLVGRLNNTGAAPLLISQIQATGAFFTQSNNCLATVLVGGFCDITVTYAPTATGAHSGQLAIHSNAIPSPHVTALSGTGITVPPPFLSTAGEVSFGQQVTGTTVRRTLVLTNTGGDPLVISSMAIIGSGAFGVEGGCGTIAPEASCSLTLTFLASGIDTFNARLDIVSNHSGGVVQVQLAGQGVALPQPDLDFSDGTLGFGNQGLNTSAQPARSVRLTNIGGAPVTISALRVTLRDFRIPASTCVGTMAPGAFCDIEVVFHPVAPGPRQASLVVDSTPAQNDSVSLVGVGCRQTLLGRNQSPARLCSP